jgi:hypothetical protein
MKPSRLRLIALVFKLMSVLALLPSNALAFTLIPPPLEEELIPSITVTDAGILDTQVQPVTSALGSHLQGVFRGLLLPKGGAAGAGDSGFHGIWVNSSYTEFENSFARTRFDGNTHMLLAGFDFTLSENIIYGLVLGTERGDIDTTFNRGNLESDGSIIAPYLGWLISDNWSLDLSLGKNDLDIDQFRTEIVTTFDTSSPPAVLITQVPEIVRSSLTSERGFENVNVNGFWTSGSWNFGARLGYLSASNEQDSYVESNGSEVEASEFELKQTQIGGDIAYGSASQVFLSAVMLKDSSSETVEFSDGEQPSDDDDSLLIGLGWRYYGEDGVSAVFELNSRDGKDDYSENSASFTLRRDFD